MDSPLSPQQFPRKRPFSVGIFRPLDTARNVVTGGYAVHMTGGCPRQRYEPLSSAKKPLGDREASPNPALQRVLSLLEEGLDLIGPTRHQVPG